MTKLKFLFDVFLVVAMPAIGYLLGFWLYFWEYVQPKLWEKFSRADESA